jgi:hypothetical protein
VHDAGEGAFGCERFKLGRESPGPVRDWEYLNLIISDPQVLDPRSGKVLPIVVNQVDKNGVSVLRDAAANSEFEITFTQLRQRSDAKGDLRYFHGVYKFLVGDVRHDGDERWLGVYDTSIPQRRHHADILAPPPQSRREAEARKKRILDTIGASVVPVADFRNGAFAVYGRDAARQAPIGEQG